MQIKILDLKKINLKQKNKILFYGNNEESKIEQFNNLSSKLIEYEKFNFNEKEILDNENVLLELFLNKSLFTNYKLILIKHATDKIYNLIKKIILNNSEDIILVIFSQQLEKKSKLRGLFEKDNTLISVPFYPDTINVLLKYALDFLKKRNILISQSNINFLINRCGNERLILKNELEKIELLSKSKKINDIDIIKLTNLIENHDISELIDSFLIQNSKKVSLILNENNFDNEDSILIIRTFLAKTKKILKLAINFEKNNNLEMTVSEAKPPIFWKDKDTFKIQLKRWKPHMLRKLISNINHIELELKKHSQSSLNILMNFMFEQLSSKH